MRGLHKIGVIGVALAVSMLGAGTGFAAPVSSGQIQHWGSFFGDLITADSDKSASPITLTLPGNVIQVGTSNSTQYALLSDGSLYAWGQGTHGELGNGANQNSFTTPVQVQFPAGVQIAYVPTDAMPYDTGLAVDTAGNAWGWGLNGGGELCTGNSQEYATPLQLPLTHVTTLAGAYGHAVYDSNGTVYSCGWGTLGTGSSKSTLVPTPVIGLNGLLVTTLVSSFSNAGALLNDGQYYDWGFSPAGQLGNGTTGPPSLVPVKVTFPDPSPVAQVAEGGSTPTNGQTLVMLSDGALFAWGDDHLSQLGDGGTGFHSSPVQFHPPTGVTYSLLASGGQTSYALTSTGDVYAWGSAVSDGSTHKAVTPILVTSCFIEFRHTVMPALHWPRLSPQARPTSIRLLSMIPSASSSLPLHVSGDWSGF